MGRAPIHERAWVVYRSMRRNGVTPAKARAHCVQRFGFCPAPTPGASLPNLTAMYGPLPQTDRVYADVIV